MIYKNKKLLLGIFFLISCAYFFSCGNFSEKDKQLPEPQIKAGIAKVKGKLNNVVPRVEFLTLKINNPVTTGVSLVESKVESDDSFYFEVPIECTPVFGTISSPSHNNVFVELSSGKEVFIELKSGSKNSLIIANDADKFFTNSDHEKMLEVGRRYREYPPNASNSISICDMTPEEYVENIIYNEKTLFDDIFKNISLSDASRKFILNYYKVMRLAIFHLPYKEHVERVCEDKENFTSQEPSIQYYSFLKSYELNNLQYADNYYYSEMVEVLLSREAFNIPLISDTPVEKWLSYVKATLSDLLGFDSGAFYDILVANAYAKQFNIEGNPLSEKQISNIKEYFKRDKEEFAKILLRKNNEIVDLVKLKEPLVINKSPSVNKDMLMNTIISKYKGKIVIVDFWATWCSPCLDAMKRYAAIKGYLQRKNVVFVYMTNGSSPTELWKKKINGIGGEHYYLSGDEWEYLMNYFGFNGIPSYVIFDTKGKIHKKFTGYPGNAEIQAMIEKLLP